MHTSVHDEALRIIHAREVKVQLGRIWRELHETDWRGHGGLRIAVLGATREACWSHGKDWWCQIHLDRRARALARVSLRTILLKARSGAGQSRQACVQLSTHVQQQA